jgi:FkbM family methyltransferase
MLVVMPELVSRAIYHYGYYEEGLTRMVLEYLRPGMVFIDIGAHLGYYTLLASTIVGDAGQVHAFEPTPSTYSILKTNTQGRKNVILNRLAVFSLGSTLQFYDYGAHYSGHNSFTTPRLPKQVLKKIHPKTFQADCVTLDDYCAINGVRPDFVKIDAESAEFDILTGMQGVIEKYHPIISLEVGDEEIPGVRRSKECVMFLIERGYRALEYKNGLIIDHTIREKYDYDNLLFIYS